MYIHTYLVQTDQSLSPRLFRTVWVSVVVHNDENEPLSVANANANTGIIGLKHT